MTTPDKSTFGFIAVAIVLAVAYLWSYDDFSERHSHILFPSGEYAFWVPDTATNRFFAVFYAPITIATQTPFRYEPEPTPRPRPNHAR